jgi:ribonuclease HII
MEGTHGRLGRGHRVKRPDPVIARALNLWAHDRALFPAGGLIIGIDEVGRGPLAGNVVAACVVLDLDDDPLPGLNDSKKLSPAKRETLAPLIRSRAVAWSVGEATPEEIDRINILQATFLAMRRALEGMQSVIAGHAGPSLLLVDGNQKIPGVNIPQTTVVGGDALSASIAAASVLAKVVRDGAMIEADARHPGYGFAGHKGYGTAAHTEAIRRMGLTPIHRRTFLKGIVSSFSAE